MTTPPPEHDPAQLGAAQQRGIRRYRQTRADDITNEGHIGHAVQNGRLRPEYGDEALEAICTVCDATWVALYQGETCTWCVDRHRALQLEQAELVLRPPDMNRSDVRWRAVKAAWIMRLADAVTANLITSEEAVRAIRNAK